MSVEHKKTITAHCIVRNDENFVPYALKSVIDYVDKIFVFDTGSTDSTPAVLEKLAKEYPNKIIFEQKGFRDKTTHTALRQEMLERTTTDWFMIVDGDEIWTKRGMEEAVDLIQTREDVTWVVTPYYLCVGDVYHSYYKEKYDPFYDRVGFFTPRFIKKTEDIEWRGDYELDTLYKKSDGKMLYTKEHITYLKHGFWHLTHLCRSRLDNEIFTSGIAKTRAEKRRLTYFLIGKKIQEPVPEVFGGSAYAKGMPFGISLKNFFKLFFGQPKLLWRRLKFYIQLGKEPMK